MLYLGPVFTAWQDRGEGRDLSADLPGSLLRSHKHFFFFFVEPGEEVQSVLWFHL